MCYSQHGFKATHEDKNILTHIHTHRSNKCVYDSIGWHVPEISVGLEVTWEVSEEQKVRIHERLPGDTINGMQQIQIPLKPDKY